jgi:two-component system, OmpR family, phosphate regulon response regulator PhoB
MKVVLATIDPQVAQLRSSLLGRKDFVVAGVTSATAIQNTVQHEHPEVLVIDMALPDTPGDGVCAEIKGNPDTAGTVVVMLVDAGDEWMEDRARQAGADHVLPKPVELGRLEQLLGDILRAPLRKAVRVPIRIKIEGATSVGEMRGESLDISSTGMRVLVADCDLESGFVIWLKFEMSPELPPMICKGEVTRLSKGRDGYQVGLRFISFNGEGANVLRRFLRSQGASD